MLNIDDVLVPVESRRVGAPEVWGRELGEVQLSDLIHFAQGRLTIPTTIQIEEVTNGDDTDTFY